MHSPLPSCTYRVGVAGDGCRYKSEVIQKESTTTQQQHAEEEEEKEGRKEGRKETNQELS